MAVRTRSKRSLAALAGAAAVLFGAIGFAHTPAGRPLLRYLPGAKVCPMGASAHRTPEQFEAQRRATLQPLLGREPARSRPALGFQLGSSTRANVLAWAERTHVACASTARAAELVCPRVPREALDEARGNGADDVSFSFDPRDRLVAVDAARRGLDPVEAARFIDERAKSLEGEAGPPSAVLGERTPAFLEPGEVRQAAVEFRFSDYLADVEATQLGALGLLVREQYRAVVD